MMTFRPVFKSLLILVTLIVIVGAPAFGSQLTRSAAELKELEGRISALSEKLSREEDERDALTAELDQIDARRARLTRSLDLGRKKRVQLQASLNKLEQEAEQLAEAQVDATVRLGALLRSGYLLGQQSGLRMLINQEDPHSAARRMAMYRYIIEARNTQLSEIAALNQRVMDNRKEMKANGAALEQTLSSLERDQAQLEADRKVREKKSALVKKAIREGKSRLGSYRKRQDALAQLLVELRRPPKKAIKPKAPSNRIGGQQGTISSAGAQSSGSGQVETGAAGTTAARAQQRATVQAADNEVKVLAGFSNNRGQLPRPLEARIEAKFGDARADGGLNWQGILYGARNGQAVRAVYPGQVVFSDWFRGYGQLMVVDHGDGYMSLYGHNQGLNAQVGETVAAGQVIASANDVSAIPVPGLYFEIRHNGAPNDPLQWIR